MANAAAIAQVRRFNRAVTQRVGALNEHYLSRDLSLGEARLLWEVGDEGCELRTLRARLELDSGYTSRLLRGLEAAALITVAPSPVDRRVRVVQLTARGAAERNRLDKRSDQLAAAILDDLDSADQRRLVEAMHVVRRLLTEPGLEIRPADPESGAARFCIESYYAELRRRSNGRFDPAIGISAEPRELVAPHGCLLLVRLHGEPVGCGAVKYHSDAPCEIKRMWVADSARGLGLGRRLLEELESLGRANGAPAAHLETNAALTEAIALYRSAGYREVPAFNDEPFADYWFEKTLD